MVRDVPVDELVLVVPDEVEVPELPVDDVVPVVPVENKQDAW